MTQNAINNTASILAVDNLTLDGNTLSSTDTNGDIVLAPNGSGTVSVTTAPIVPSGDRADSLGSATNSWDNVYADGLTFDDGTNTLGTYVETTSWTPGLEFGGASVGITYSFQEGNYTRIGNIAFIYCAISLSNKGSSTGNATITGFPLTMAAYAQNTAMGNYNYLTLAVGRDHLFMNSAASVSTFSIYQAGSATNFISTTDANFANNSQINTLLWRVVV